MLRSTHPGKSTVFQDHSLVRRRSPYGGVGNLKKRLGLSGSRPAVVGTTVVGRLGAAEGPLKSSRETSKPLVSRHNPITPTSHAGSRRPAELSRGTSGTPSGTTWRAITRTANSRGRSTAARKGSTSTSSGLIGSMTGMTAIAANFARASQRPSGLQRYSSRLDGTMRVSIASIAR